MLASDTRKLDAVARRWRAVQDYMIQYTKAYNELTKQKQVDPKSFEGSSRSARILRFELKQATKGYTKYVKKEAKFFQKFNAVRETEINSIEPAAGAVVVFKDQKDALVMGSVQIDDLWPMANDASAWSVRFGMAQRRELETGERLENEPNSVLYHFHHHLLHVPSLVRDKIVQRLQG